MATYPSIVDPSSDPDSVRASVLSLKETVEILTRQRKPVSAGAVTWKDLLELKLITADQVPTR